MHKLYWSRDAVPNDSREFALALADKEKLSSFSKSYKVYWKRCFVSFSRFYAGDYARLLPSIDLHPRLVLEKKAIFLSEK